MNSRTSMLAALALLLLTSCGREASSPRDFADRFTAAEAKAWSTGNTDDLKAIEDTSVVFHLPGADLNGWKSHEAFILSNRTTVTDLKQTWKYLSGESNHIALAYQSSATRKGDDKNAAQALSNDYLFVLKLKDGKVVEIWANGTQTSKPLNP